MRGNKFLKYTVVQVVERRILVTENYKKWIRVNY